MPAAIAFALSNGKRFGLAETGTGNFGVTTAGGGPADEGHYPIYLAERLAPAVAQGLKLELVEIWAQPTGSDRLTFLSGYRPLEATGWKEFGAIMAAARMEKNLAAGKRPYASSTENSSFAPANATDGQNATRWSSNPGNDKQWIFVDLGQRYTISRVRLSWDAAYASGYSVQTLISGTTWTTIYKTTTADGGVDDIRGLSGLGRYMRIFAHTRGSQLNNYSLQEFAVHP